MTSCVRVPDRGGIVRFPSPVSPSTRLQHGRTRSRKEITVEVHDELSFADVADESVGESRFNFRVFVHPLLADEFAVLHNQRPGSAQLVIGIGSSGPDWWSNGKKMDAGSTQDFVSKLRDLTADKFVESGFANPSIDITVTSDEGKRVEKVFISKSGDNSIAKRENESALYQLDASSVEALEKSADGIKPVAAPGK